ncbi:hypothetical protein F8M41_013004 [Gigaspora margarita]|uniref:Uncharacterized protein n=1 Tax=Gigaspora margarita TaxID=4874 RepID=A0A8H4ASL3_GIGMA|nr:hypothetical protein F8M41_013004 [Gigaspora margarita]
MIYIKEIHTVVVRNTAKTTLIHLNELDKRDPLSLPLPIPPPLPIASPPLSIAPPSEPLVAAPPSEFSVALSGVSSSEEQTIRNMIFDSDDMYIIILRMRVVTTSVQIEFLTNITIKISGNLPLFKQMQGKIVKNKWGRRLSWSFHFLQSATVKLEEDTSVIKN